MHNHPPAGERRRVIMMKTGYSTHGCGSEDVDMSLKNKTCQPASGAQDSRASLELYGYSLDKI